MAITKYKVIKKNLEAVINYAKNGEKTENGILVSGINCLPDTVYSQMALAKKTFHKEDGRLGYHFIQSFNGNEVSSEKANQIGVELAQQLWGDKYQVLVCTHTNKENVHNHLILNSVSFVDGSKYHNSNLDLALLRQTNDDLCMKYDLSVVESTNAKKGNEIAKSRISHYNRTNGKMELIKADIDEAIQNATKYQDFEDELRCKGYYIKSTGKYFTVTSPYYNRNIRLFKCFGEDYTLENIKHRIYQSALYYQYLKQDTNEKIYVYKTYDKVQIDPEKLKNSSFYRLYVHYLYLFGKLPAKIHYEYRTKEYYKEIDKFDKMCEELQMIGKYDFNTTADVQMLITKLAEEVAPLKSQREQLEKKYRKTTDTTEKECIQEEINQLTENIDKINSKLQICRRIIVNSEKGEKEKQLLKNRQEENLQKTIETCKMSKKSDRARY